MIIHGSPNGATSPQCHDYRWMALVRHEPGTLLALLQSLQLI